jgi:hypothetical protein
MNTETTNFTEDQKSNSKVTIHEVANSQNDTTGQFTYGTKKPMNKVLIGVFCFLGLLLIITGIIVWKVMVAKPTVTPPIAETNTNIEEDIKPADTSILVNVVPSKIKDHAVTISVSGLGGKVKDVEYELTYDSEGIIQGVNSGSKPIDTSGQDSFEREVYLGTCSKNVCTPHPGVKGVTLTMIFTNTDGTKSQYSKDFPLTQ